MKELRGKAIDRQNKEHLLRVLYVFDPRRVAILLIGGDKVGDSSRYETHVPIADDLYEEHLRTIKREQRKADKQKSKKK